MVEVGEKSNEIGSATALAVIKINKNTITLIKENNIKNGNVLTNAQITV